MPKRKMRPDEEFVMSNLAASLGPGVSWWPGEDPPDCYLKVGGKVIAVEISILPQLVVDDHGESIPRLSQDMIAVRICNELDIELNHLVPKGITVYLILEAPINKPRKFKSELADLIKTSMENAQNIGCIVKREILSNRVEIRMKNERPCGKRIIGIVTNRRSSPLILANAKQTLDERIQAKAEKCKPLNFTGPIWLALFNDYWLAEPDTYKQAIKTSDVAHCFDRIYLINDAGMVVPLYLKHQG